MSTKSLRLQINMFCQKWLSIFELFVMVVSSISIEQNFKGDLLRRMHWTSFDLDYFFIQLKVVFSCTEWSKKRKIIFAKFFEIQGQGQSYNSRVQYINNKFIKYLENKVLVANNLFLCVTISRDLYTFKLVYSIFQCCWYYRQYMC